MIDIPVVDIIILSYAKTEDLKRLTLQSISTLLESEDPKKVKFNILVIESSKLIEPYQYKNATTVYPKERFGFHKYLNIGIKLTNNPYVVLCNNDLIFHKGWATEILKAMEENPGLMSASPYCPNFHKERGFADIGPPQEGYFGLLVGWCIFVKREIFNTIGELDENLVFWYCDSDYCQSLLRHKIKHCLVPASVVTHLGGESLKTVNSREHRKLTQIPRFYYNYKWNHKSYLRFKIEVFLFKLNLLPNLGGRKF